MTYLKNYEILSSQDLHEMQGILAKTTETHKVDVIGKEHEINASLRSASFGSLNLMHVTYGNIPTQVQTYENDEDALLLFILTDGAARGVHKNEEFEISSTVGLMREAHLPLTAQQNAFATFVVPLPRDLLKRYASALYDHEVNNCNLIFNPTLDLTTANGRHVRNTVHYISDAIDGPLLDENNTIVMKSLEDLLLTSVLSCLPHDYFGTNRPSQIVPYHVKRARDYIHAHAASVITLETLANYAGCGYRTLQVAFKDIYGMSPMVYVKHVRLSYVHEDLLQATEGGTVRDIALKWGFTHMSWFSKIYMQKYGVLPSHTLRIRG